MPGALVIPRTYLYCTQADVEGYMSVVGLKLRLDDIGDGTITAKEQQRFTDAAVEASETIDYYLFDKYDPSYLATSNWVNRRATWLAAYRMASARMNPRPDVVEEDAAKAEEELKDVRDHGGKVPGLPLRRILAPVWSNTRVVPWPYQFRCIRVERNQSSQHDRSAIPQNVDREDAVTYESQGF